LRKDAKAQSKAVETRQCFAPFRLARKIFVVVPRDPGEITKHSTVISHESSALSLERLLHFAVAEEQDDDDQPTKAKHITGSGLITSRNSDL